MRNHNNWKNKTISSGARAALTPSLGARTGTPMRPAPDPRGAVAHQGRGGEMFLGDGPEGPTRGARPGERAHCLPGPPRETSAALPTKRTRSGQSRGGREPKATAAGWKARAWGAQLSSEPGRASHSLANPRNTVAQTGLPDTAATSRARAAHQSQPWLPKTS